ncbi:hypothetical protein Sste5346_003822 [Sporothrix stenoceras]|uniref:DASH complex subunit DAD2 n=1 Tax=Sporothrix stenoceras TaxID=5173 RepID=A0ABR3ZBM0_9PEZI
MPKTDSKLKALQEQEEELTSNFVNALCRLQTVKSKAMAVGDYLIREWSGLDDMNAYAATVAAADVATDLPEVVPSQPSRRREVLKESKKQMAHNALKWSRVDDT